MDGCASPGIMCRPLTKKGSPLAKLRAEQMEIVKQKLEDIVEGGDRRIAVE